MVYCRCSAGQQVASQDSNWVRIFQIALSLPFRILTRLFVLFVFVVSEHVNKSCRVLRFTKPLDCSSELRFSGTRS